MSGTPTSSKSKVDKIIVGSGRNNLFHTLLLFLHHVKQVWSLIQQIRIAYLAQHKRLISDIISDIVICHLKQGGRKAKKILLKGLDR